MSNIYQDNTIAYSTEVTIKVVRGKHVVQEVKTHNRGTEFFFKQLLSAVLKSTTPNMPSYLDVGTGFKDVDNEFTSILASRVPITGYLTRSDANSPWRATFTGYVSASLFNQPLTAYQDNPDMELPATATPGYPLYVKRGSVYEPATTNNGGYPFDPEDTDGPKYYCYTKDTAAQSVPVAIRELGLFSSSTGVENSMLAKLLLLPSALTVDAGSALVVEWSIIFANVKNTTGIEQRS